MFFASVRREQAAALLLFLRRENDRYYGSLLLEMVEYLLDHLSIRSLFEQHFNAQLAVSLSGLLIGAKNLTLARQRANKHPRSHL